MSDDYEDARADYRLALLKSLYDLFMTRAYGRSVDEVEFERVRLAALREPHLGPLLPAWLREVRTPRDWSIYATTRFNGTSQTREFLRREFAPIFGTLEGFEVQPDTSPIRGDHGGRPFRYPGTEVEEDPAAYVPSKRVFLVHGHDHAPRNAVEAYLRRLGLEPVVLSDEPSRSRTIIEKLEAYDDVDYAVIILTPDDIGAPASAPDQLQPRARQNVILELGYFVGRLGRDFVAALLVGEVDLPSDVRGVAYIPYQDTNEVWKGLLLRELRHTHMPINLDAI